MEDFDNALILADTVINQDRTVQQLADTRTLPDGTAHSGKSRQKLHMIEQRTAKTRGSFGVILSDVPDDLGEIA